MDDSFDGQADLTDLTESVSDEFQPELGLTPLSSPYSTQGEQVVNYFFPVEIVVSGSLVPQEREIIQAQIYQDLHDAIIDKLT
jgi:hypothetical protein